MTDRTRYALCWAADRLVMALPLDWRLTWWLLPWAGLYAYSDSFEQFRKAITQETTR